MMSEGAVRSRDGATKGAPGRAPQSLFRGRRAGNGEKMFVTMRSLS